MDESSNRFLDARQKYLNNWLKTVVLKQQNPPTNDQSVSAKRAHKELQNALKKFIAKSD
jgi:hypothetical protein